MTLLTISYPVVWFPVWIGEPVWNMVNTGSLCGEVYEDHIDVGKDEEIKDAKENIRQWIKKRN